MPPRQQRELTNIDLLLLIGKQEEELKKALTESAVLGALMMVIKELNRYYKRVLHDEKPQEWLTMRVDCMWGDDKSLQMLVERRGVSRVRDLLNRELPNRPELHDSRVRVTVGNRHGDISVLVFKIFPAI